MGLSISVENMCFSPMSKKRLSLQFEYSYWLGHGFSSQPLIVCICFTHSQTRCDDDREICEQQNKHLRLLEPGRENLLA